MAINHMFIIEAHSKSSSAYVKTAEYADFSTYANIADRSKFRTVLLDKQHILAAEWGALSWEQQTANRVLCCLYCPGKNRSIVDVFDRALGIGEDELLEYGLLYPDFQAVRSRVLRGFDAGSPAGGLLTEFMDPSECSRLPGPLWKFVDCMVTVFSVHAVPTVHGLHSVLVNKELGVDYKYFEDLARVMSDRAERQVNIDKSVDSKSQID